MLLAQLVETSRRVAETSRRLAKIDLLAALLRQAGTGEIETVTAYLSGRTRQNRIGVGYAGLRGAQTDPAEQPSLEISEADRVLQAMADTAGPGSDRRKRELLHSLFSRATGAEQTFLTGLLHGELRQGAMEGVMLEALAKAFAASPERVRRAAMLSGDLVTVARLLAESGEAGLEGCDIQLFRPVQPMLAQTAEDVEGALHDLGEAALEYKFDG